MNQSYCSCHVSGECLLLIVPMNENDHLFKISQDLGLTSLT